MRCRVGANGCDLSTPLFRGKSARFRGKLGCPTRRVDSRGGATGFLRYRSSSFNQLLNKEIQVNDIYNPKGSRVATLLL